MLKARVYREAEVFLSDEDGEVYDDLATVASIDMRISSPKHGIIDYPTAWNHLVNAHGNFTTTVSLFNRFNSLPFMLEINNEDRVLRLYVARVYLDISTGDPNTIYFKSFNRMHFRDLSRDFKNIQGNPYHIKGITYS